MRRRHEISRAESRSCFFPLSCLFQFALSSLFKSLTLAAGLLEEGARGRSCFGELDRMEWEEEEKGEVSKKEKKIGRARRALPFSLSSLECIFFCRNSESESLVPLPDTEAEPAATTARQTPMKAKTEERAILAAERGGVVFFFFGRRRRRRKVEVRRRRRRAPKSERSNVFFFVACWRRSLSTALAQLPPQTTGRGSLLAINAEKRANRGA